MIIGVGTDLVDIERIAGVLERQGDRFLERCYTPYEQEKAAEKTQEARSAYLAKRFAAKEALAKALGRGISGFSFTDIGVENDAAGRPFFVLQGGAHEALEGLMPQGCRPKLHLSLSDEKKYALAFVVIEAVCL